ncbi:winged helix-turn-helix domain-containing protein [Sphaerisporangium sp. NPDC088356]|uniref:winged helix-turn-helix domain-containing protein n=1 Tax=Sphaerisporangium sp. NPDC088356 TaxID=3154871 RepID=UPI0034267EDE
MIDPDADRPVYKQLVDLVHEQIERGRLGPDQRLPAESDYVEMHGISRDSERRAMGVLRAEGLIVTTNRGSRVRAGRQRSVVQIGDCDVVTARMPSEPERRQLGVKEGVPIFVVERSGGERELLPGDRTEIRGESFGG